MSRFESEMPETDVSYDQMFILSVDVVPSKFLQTDVLIMHSEINGTSQLTLYV